MEFCELEYIDHYYRIRKIIKDIELESNFKELYTYYEYFVQGALRNMLEGFKITSKIQQKLLDEFMVELEVSKNISNKELEDSMFLSTCNEPGKFWLLIFNASAEIGQARKGMVFYKEFSNFYFELEEKLKTEYKSNIDNIAKDYMSSTSNGIENFIKNW